MAASIDNFARSHSWPVERLTLIIKFPRGAPVVILIDFVSGRVTGLACDRNA